MRARLIERAAELVSAREEVTLRGLAAAAGTSTMGVYTHFGGMPGLWSAVRQEGFTRLAARLAAVGRTEDPVHDLAALCAAYAEHALAEPDLYRAMFETRHGLADSAAADATFGMLIDAVARARAAGRFTAGTDPAAAATRIWAAGHGLLSLAISGVLDREVVLALAPETLADQCAGLGDAGAGASVAVAWRSRPPSRRNSRIE